MVISRMRRRGRYKLIWHRGHPEQFFDLENDPKERNDLAGDPALRDVRDGMRERLLSDWDPDRIAATLETRKAEHRLLADWAAQVEPPDLIRWPMKPEYNWLADRTATG